MKNDLRAKWLAALRSGEYEQGTGHLYTFKEEIRGDKAGTHCCLGVLTRLLGYEYNESRQCFSWPDDTDDSVRNSSYIPPGIAKSIGLTEETQELLAHKNDNGESFVEIADWIEANIPADSPVCSAADEGE